MKNTTRLLLALAVTLIPQLGSAQKKADPEGFLTYSLPSTALFAAGVVPLPVLLASSISQDGHASIPLLAESKKSFLMAKLINCIVALAAGFTAMLFF